MPAMKRVGHKGAHHIAPGNTVASFEAALAHGVDMIEFDVLLERSGGDGSTGALLLAHDYEDARRSDVIELDEALAHLAGADYARLELDLDLKLPGYEGRVLEALAAHGLSSRALISTMERESLRAIRALDPSMRIGLSVPSCGATCSRPAGPATPPTPRRAPHGARCPSAPPGRSARASSTR